MNMPGFTAEASLYQSSSTFAAFDGSGAEETAALQICDYWTRRRCRWAIRDCRRYCWGQGYWCISNCLYNSGRGFCVNCLY